MRPPPPLLILLMITAVAAQITVPMSGQCQAVCLKEMAKRKEFIALNGETFLDYDVTNNTDFSLCKLGCHSPDFSELGLPAFRRGQAAYQSILERSSDAPLSASPISSVSLMCVDSNPNGSVSGRLQLSTNTSPSDVLVYHIEGVRRHSEESPEAIFFATWSYSPYVDFTTNFKENTASVQFRVTSFDPDGIKGQASRSPWIPLSAFLTSSESRIITKPRRTFWKDDSAASELSVESANSGIVPCTLSLTYSADDHHEQSIQFQLDRSSGFLLERLHFDTTYMIRVDGSPVRPSNNPPLSLRVPACLQMVSDSSLCAPSPVTELHWKWNLSRTEGNTILLSWEYNPEDKMNIEKPVTIPRMVHFEITLTPSPLCQFREAQRRTITWTHRSVLLYVADERCEYEADVVVVDAKSRRSPPKRVILRQEEPSVLALTSKFNVEMLVLLSLLAVLLVMALSMAACRIKDRNTFNTLKREHRQLTKSIVVAQATLPRNKCLTVIDGKGRPISTDESELSIPVKPRLPQLPAIFYDDEGVYDSLDTPTRSEAAYFDRSSFGSFKRANPIYAGVNVHGLMTLPMERLNMTSCVRNPTKPWINASAIDRIDNTSYFLKYSAEDSSSLRQELSVLSHISTDHPNLLYFQGVATRESQVLAILFEPIRGGSLRSYLAEVRATFGIRSPSSSSSGYDGSEKDCLDDVQIDRLTSQLCSFSRQVASGLSFIHAQRCVHGGVSPSSVYLMKSWKDPMRMPCDQVAKLSDFDQSQLESSPDALIRLPSEISPPEVLAGRPHTPAGDIWQMGLLLAEIVSLGSCPSLWEASAGSVSEKAVKNFYGNLSAGHRMNPGLSSLKKAIPRCLSVDFKRRCISRDLEGQLISLQQQYSDFRSEHVDSVEV